MGCAYFKRTVIFTASSIVGTVNANKLGTYLGDIILAIGAGYVFIKQGTSKAPNFEIMVLCILTLLGRTAYAINTWLGGRDTTEQSVSSEQRTSLPVPRSPLSQRQSDNEQDQNQNT